MALLPQSAWTDAYNQLCVDLRNTYLSELYYECKARSLSMWNTVVEVVIAGFATGSAISGWTVWQTNEGKGVWAFLAGSASVLALLQPFLRLADKAKLASSLHSGFKSIHLELHDLWRDLRLRRCIDERDREVHKSIVERSHKLELQEPPNQDDDLARRCVEQVRKRYSASELWVPEFKGDGDDRSKTTSRTAT